MKIIFTFIFSFIAAFLFGAILKFIPITLGTQPTITVVGEAKVDQIPQIAKFYASVSVFNSNKAKAVDEVNVKMEQLIKALKDFGIDPKNIQTQTISVNEINSEPEIMIYPPSPGKRLSGWQASNSITVILEDISQASNLTNLLQTSGATDISGPNFSLDDTKIVQSELLRQAIENAQEKARLAAQAGGRKLGKILTVVIDGYSYNPIPLYLGGGKMDSVITNTSIEPGTERLTQTATVVFELK